MKRFKLCLKARLRMKRYRDRMRAAGRCICGPSAGGVSPRSGIEHGPVVKAGKCARCIEVHARSR